YFFRTISGTFLLTHPEKLNKITAVYRGNGPMFSPWKENISFDDFLLEEAGKKGVKIFHERVDEIEIPGRRDERVRITSAGNGRSPEFDLVVGAFGLNTGIINKIKNLNFGYKPPKTLKVCQTELFLGSDIIRETFGNNIYTINAGIKDIRFAAIIPKDDFITISLIGMNNIEKRHLIQFLQSEPMRALLPDRWEIPETLCFCHPRIATTPAKNPFTDRFVIIGDPSYSRYYKNGIESALITARAAAWTAFHRGISRDDFKRFYYKKVRDQIIRDNYYGRLLFRLNDFISRRKFIVEIHQKIGQSEGYTAEIMKSILWNMFTGNIEYKKIFLRTLNPVLQMKIFITMIETSLSKISNFITARIFRKAD
ncbi:MAG: NAD(P)/FAD-dependent oxidoreductase, partial [Fidelibacterota bacterium]